MSGADHAAALLELRRREREVNGFVCGRACGSVTSVAQTEPKGQTEAP